MAELIGRFGEYHTYPPLKAATVAGAAAGNITVAGIKPGDTLMVVNDVAAADANLVEEFEITAVDTINNTGGTNTTGMVLLILWYSAAEGLAGE